MFETHRIHNLAARQNSGTSVRIDWDQDQDEILVTVQSATANFILHPPKDKALDCYYHPFAYFDRVLTSGNYR